MTIEAIKAVVDLIEMGGVVGQEDIVKCLRSAIEQAERVKRAEEAFAAASDDMKGEQAERQEPVATLFGTLPVYDTAPPQRQPSGSFVAWNNTLCNPLAPAEKQNLSAWEDGYASGIKDQLQPLTEEVIDELARTMVKGERSVNWLARAIERAHGIGGEHEGSRAAGVGCEGGGD